MGLDQQIVGALQQAFSPSHLEVINESFMHNVPKNAETHYKLIIVSSKFEDLKLIQRHRQVNQTMMPFFNQGVHAAAIHTYTPDEWQHQDLPSPTCKGGFKHQKESQ